jgi:hypothetical protein
MNHSNIINEYSKSNQHICLCSTVSIVLILLFIISPLNKWVMTSMFGKLLILIILGYTTFYNIKLTNKLSNQTGVYLVNGSWSPIKINIICSSIFSLFLFILILIVIQSLFK